MKKLFLLLSVALISIGSMAQMYLWEGGHYLSANIDSITFAEPNVDSTFTIEESFVEFSEGTTGTLTLVDNMYDASLYRWSSSNIGTVSVLPNGQYTTHRPGLAIISVSYAGRSQSCFVSVYDAYLYFEDKEMSLEVGHSELLPLNYTDEDLLVTFTSSDPSIVSVNKDGIATAHKPGTVEITLKCGSCTDTMIVHAYAPETPNEPDTPPTPPTDESETYVVTISNETLTMGLGDTYRLAATVTPSVTTDFVWTSSNPEIVTVTSKGIVEAVGLGTATITVTLKDIPAEQVAPAMCVVSVTNDAIFDNFAIGGYGIFELGDPIEGTDTILTISVGDVKCQLCPSSYIVWDNELTYSDQSGLSGAGFLIEVEALTYVIVEGDYAGYYIGNGALNVDSIVVANPSVAYTGVPGKLVDLNAYGDAWNKFLTLTNSSPEDEINAALDLYDNSQVGTQLFRVDFSTGEQSYNYGNVTSATIVEGEGELYYNMNIEWYDAVNPDRLYGLLLDIQVDEEGNETTSIVEPYDMRYIYKQYEYMPLEEDQPAELPAKRKNIDYSNQVPRLPLNVNKDFLRALPRR